MKDTFLGGDLNVAVFLISVGCLNVAVTFRSGGGLLLGDTKLTLLLLLLKSRPRFNTLPGEIYLDVAARVLFVNRRDCIVEFFDNNR